MPGTVKHNVMRLIIEAHTGHTAKLCSVGAGVNSGILIDPHEIFMVLRISSLPWLCVPCFKS